VKPEASRQLVIIKDGGKRMMLLPLLLVSLVLGSPMNVDLPSSGSDSHAFNYIVTIIMENHDLNEIIGSSQAPFLNQLASSGSLATGYSAVNHPSLPNYLALVSGQDFGSWSTSDCPAGPGCNAGNATNIVDSLEANGLTWKAYMEDYPATCTNNCSPGNCYLGDGGISGRYVVRHDPFVYFSDIVNSSARCSRIVPANSGGNGAPDDLFLADLQSPSNSSNFMWLTPNVCNDMHDCSISTGDTYLSQLVPMILGSNLFTHQKAALFILFDEGNGDHTSPSDYVYAVWAGPVAKTSFTSSIQYSHYSFLRTVEANWQLPPLTSNDQIATPMLEFFILPPDGWQVPSATQVNNGTVETSPAEETLS
jgi:phosphatidylinositol-3-phosphatase